MTVLIILFLATCFLSYSNGANDNFKGVATLYGSGITDFKTSLRWATITTFAGSITSLFISLSLITAFSGKGLFPDAVVGTPQFLLSVALGSGLTVIFATQIGFPISTTHSLIGALTGAGLVAVGTEINLGVLKNTFFLPFLWRMCK